MKKTLIALTLGLLVSTGSAFAADIFWVGDVADSPGNFVATNVMTFDWSSSGSGVAVGLGPYGSINPVGTEFEFLYQSSLVGVTGTSGQAIAFPGLDTAFEYTVVATVPESIYALSVVGNPFPNTATFLTEEGGSFYIYYDNAADSDVATGTNFDDGVLVASGTIVPGQYSTFSALSPTLGSGSFIFYGVVDYANPLYLDPTTLNGDPWLIGFRAEGTLNFPPIDSSTTGMFVAGYDGTTNQGGYPNYTIANNDLLLKTDASSKFTVVPEPSTIILLGCGLLGLAGVCRRRSRQ